MWKGSMEIITVARLHLVPEKDAVKLNSIFCGSGPVLTQECSVKEQWIIFSVAREMRYAAFYLLLEIPPYPLEKSTGPTRQSLI